MKVIPAVLFYMFGKSEPFAYFFCLQLFYAMVVTRTTIMVTRRKKGRVAAMKCRQLTYVP